MSHQGCASRWKILPAVVFMSITILLSFAVGASSPPGLGSSFDEVVKSASKEGQVRLAGSLTTDEVKRVFAPFYKKYPQIKVEYTHIVDVKEAEKIFTEALAGVAEYDAVKLITEVRDRFLKAGLLAGPFEWKRYFPKTPEQNISPDGYFAGGSFYPRVMAYNPTLVPAARVPRKWEDCLDPYWKGKLVVEVRPATLVSLYHVWGEAKVLDYARKIKENNPVWKSGVSEILAQVAAGEYPLVDGTAYASVVKLINKDPHANIRVAWPREVPVNLNEAMGILKAAKNPNAAFLVLGWLAQEEAAKGYDKIGRGSPFLEGTESWQAFKKAGAKAIFAGWDEGDYAPALTEKIVSLWGFRASKAK